MSATLTSTGLTTETFTTVLGAIADQIQLARGLTDAQRDRIAEDVRSSYGQIARIFSELEVSWQEALASLYDSLSISATGANLDRVAALLGITRVAVLSSEVVVTFNGTATTPIPNGTRVQFNDDETVWTSIDGPSEVGGGGTVSVRLRADDAGIALEPDSGGGGWTLLDSIPAITSVTGPTSQPIVGAPQETDAALRVRMGIEAYRRGQGPLRAIRAAVSAVAGVTYVNVYENRTFVTNADGMPGKSINVVVEGGDDTEIANAILDSRSAGAELYASVAQGVTVNLAPLAGYPVAVRFDRVEDVEIWIECTIATSTSEEQAPADVDDIVAALILEKAQEIFGIGDDVTPYKLIGAIYAAGIEGIDDVVMNVGFSSSPSSDDKLDISIRQRAVFDAARIDVTEA
jgi:uncharacterized phage protein gp47/JayE